MSKEISTEPIKKTSPSLILLRTGDFKLIKQGAEAKLYHGLYETNKPVIIKERFNKTYRLPELDKSLNKRRTRNEEKLLNKAGQLGVLVPRVHKTDIDNGLIIMEFVDNSKTCRDFILELVKSARDGQAEFLNRLGVQVGRVVGQLHKNEIIHGDLTTSNMLLKNFEQLAADDSSENIARRLYFIDFGLSHISTQNEDKAVDLYVLERALLSTHSVHAKTLFESILAGYALEHTEHLKEVMDRLKQVQLRGRKRSMVG